MDSDKLLTLARGLHPNGLQLHESNHEYNSMNYACASAGKDCQDHLMASPGNALQRLAKERPHPRHQLVIATTMPLHKTNGSLSFLAETSTLDGVDTKKDSLFFAQFFWELCWFFKLLHRFFKLLHRLFLAAVLVFAARGSRAQMAQDPEGDKESPRRAQEWPTEGPKGPGPKKEA